jgi:hypothetical protein
MLDIADCSIAVENNANKRHQQRSSCNSINTNNNLNNNLNNKSDFIQKCSMQIGDISIDSFACLKDIIFGDILAFHEKLKYLTIGIFKYAVYYNFLKIFFALHNYTITTPLFSPLQHICIYLVTMLIMSGFIMQGDYGTTLRIHTMRVYPLFYRFGKLHHFRWFKAHFIECILIAFIQALLFTFFLESGIFGF